ncbi:hypothetical protein Xenpb_01301 [Xenorhabdus sp. PB62.4]|nr:hypothetical protein [Xenorhabdus sp. PB62.4]
MRVRRLDNNHDWTFGNTISGFYTPPSTSEQVTATHWFVNGIAN